MIAEISKHFVDGGREACGFVLLTGEVVSVENQATDPLMDFEVSEADLEKYEALSSATWHTHPSTGCNLSVTDYACFLVFPHLSHYIFDGVRLAHYVVEEGFVILKEIQTL